MTSYPNPDPCSNCKDVWCLLAGVLAGVVLLALFWAVPLLLALALVTGILEILAIILVIVVILLALAVLLKALLCLLRKFRILT